MYDYSKQLLYSRKQWFSMTMRLAPGAKTRFRTPSAKSPSEDFSPCCIWNLLRQFSSYYKTSKRKAKKSLIVLLRAYSSPTAIPEGSSRSYPFYVLKMIPLQSNLIFPTNECSTIYLCRVNRKQFQMRTISQTNITLNHQATSYSPLLVRFPSPALHELNYYLIPKVKHFMSLFKVPCLYSW